MRVGLLGGSFNPAHWGHVHLSRMALRRLGLDRVVWVVARRNPHKLGEEMAGFGDRVSFARSVAGGAGGVSRIYVSDIEGRLGLTYTADLVAAMRRRYRRVYFAWLMGADVMVDFHRWRRWEDIVCSVPVACFGRLGYVGGALSSRAFVRFGGFRVDESDGLGLVLMRAPALMFLGGVMADVSGTGLRRGGGANAPVKGGLGGSLPRQASFS